MVGDNPVRDGGVVGGRSRGYRNMFTII